jgi:hypothetical protein
MASDGLLEQALWFKRRFGMNILFSDGRDPSICGSWSGLMSEEQTDEDLEKLYDRVKHRATAFGLVCGFNNIVAFDFDWPWVYKLWAREFGDRAKTLTIKTPNGGFRPLYYSSDVRSFDGFKESLHVEVKGRGKYAVLYGKALREDNSLGSYEVVLDLPLKRDDEIVEDSIKWFKKLLERWSFLTFNCVKAQLKTKTISPDHNLRLIIADFMMFSGIPIEEAKLFFESCPDYRESITKYQLEYTMQRIRQGLKPPSCGKIREMLGWSKDACRGCPRTVEWVEEESEKASEKHQKRRRHALVVDGALYETVLDEKGSPKFLGFKDGQWVLLDHLETEDESGRRVEVHPASTVEQPYRPYRLYDGWDIVRCPAEVYGMVRGFIRRRVDAPEHYIDLMALDVCLTYFQEKVNTLHYLYFVGDNESGKTRALQVMAMLAYRAFFATDVSAANLIEFLGDENDGLIRGSIFEDEAEDLVSDPDKRRLYKHGYKKGGKVPRVLIDKEHGRRRQRFYNAYCFKAVASEELPSGRYSKGLLERFVILHMLKGDPEKDDLDDEDYEEADRIRLELLKTRLIHYNSKLPEPELKVPLKISEKTVEEKLKARSRELFGSLLKTAAFFQALDVAREVVGKILTEKVSSRLDSLEGIICRALSKLIKPGDLKDDRDVELEFEDIFMKIAEEVNGEIEEKNGKRRILSSELDFEITPQLLGRKLTDLFQASRVLKKENGNPLRLRRFSKKVLRTMFKKYYIQRSDFENNVHNFEKQPSFDKIHGTDRTDLTDISSRESSTLNAVPINRGVQGDAPKDGKIHSLESLEEFKAEKKEPSKTEKSVTSVLSVTATFEDEKQTSNIPSISQKPNVHSILDMKSNEDIKSIKSDGFIIVGEPAFDGNCELCGETGVNVVFRFKGSSRQFYAHKVCLENREALERFYRLVFKKMEKTGETAEKRLELGEKVKAAYELYHRLLEPALNMVEEEVFIKALKDIDREPERFLDHLKKHGMIFAPREGWIRWIK